MRVETPISGRQRQQVGSYGGRKKRRPGRAGVEGEAAMIEAFGGWYTSMSVMAAGARDADEG